MAEYRDMLDLLVNEGGGSLQPGEWLKLCEEKKVLTSKQFKSRKEKLIKKLNLVVQEGKTSNTVCRLADGVIKDPATGDYILQRTTYGAKAA